MKSTDAMLKELLATESDEIVVSLPDPFYRRLVLAGRRKFGTIPKLELMKKAIVHAAAIGLLAWEKELNHKPRAVKAKPGKKGK